MSRVASYEDLVELLNSEKATFRHDPAAQVVEMPTRSGPLEGFIYLRWEKNLPYVQIITTMIVDVPEARALELIEAIARVNHVIALPGFGYDFAKRFVYFRLTLPYDSDGLGADLLKRMILGSVANARDFVLPFKAVIGGQPGSQILELVVAEDRARRSRQGDDPGETFKE